MGSFLTLLVARQELLGPYLSPGTLLPSSASIKSKCKVPSSVQAEPLEGGREVFALLVFRKSSSIHDLGKHGSFRVDY